MERETEAQTEQEMDSRPQSCEQGAGWKAMSFESAFLIQVGLSPTGDLWASSEEPTSKGNYPKEEIVLVSGLRP